MTPPVIPPVLRDFPDTIETERLLIRVPRPGDGKRLNEAVIESMAELKLFIPWATHIPTVEENEQFSRTAAARFALREDLPMFILRKADGVFLGGIGLHRFNWNVPKFEIGYWLRTSAHHQGYMIEAVNAMTKFGFEVLNAERMEIHCDERNEKSAAVALRAGYLQEGLLRHNARDNEGNLCNSLIFSKLRAEYFGQA